MEQIIPAFFLIAVLVLIVPSFLSTNSKSKLFFKNLFIWSIIVACVMLFSFVILK